MYSARVILDSICEHRLTTMEVTLPRIVLAEFNTHCMFARNSASSRAIPVEKQIKRVIDDPFIPVYWGKNQPGMQAEVELDEEEKQNAVTVWLRARDNAICQVQWLLDLKVHKQITNRLLEPFMWHTILFTGTADAYANFFHLRRSPMAQPEIRKAADLVWEAYRQSTPVPRSKGIWHLPLISQEDYEEKDIQSDTLKEISVARCARVSYLTHDGKRDHSEDLKLYARLRDSGHWSPFEHVAMAVGDGERHAKYLSWKSYRHFFYDEYVTSYSPEEKSA